MSEPSPIDPALLRPVLAPTLGESRTLPAEAYLSDDVFAWEERHFFEDGWVCLGRSDNLERAGDQRAFRVGREGILLVRDQDGGLNGFFNVCRHRGHELLEPGGERNLRAIKCPYHAWVYGLDGTLKGAPRFGDVAGFDRAEYPLVRARVAEWHGWVFVNASGTATDLADAVGNLDGLISAWEPERLFVGGRHEYVIRGELEDDHRELPRVLPLPVDPPGAVRGDAAGLGGELPARRRVGRRLDGAEGLRRDDVAHRGVRWACGSAA